MRSASTTWQSSRTRSSGTAGRPGPSTRRRDRFDEKDRWQDGLRVVFYPSMKKKLSASHPANLVLPGRYGTEHGRWVPCVFLADASGIRFFMQSTLEVLIIKENYLDFENLLFFEVYYNCAICCYFWRCGKYIQSNIKPLYGIVWSKYSSWCNNWVWR